MILCRAPGPIADDIFKRNIVGFAEEAAGLFKKPGAGSAIQIRGVEIRR
jgi:hypothetical protein